MSIASDGRSISGINCVGGVLRERERERALANASRAALVYSF